MTELERTLAEINGSLATIASLYLAKCAYDSGLIDKIAYADMAMNACKYIDNHSNKNNET